MSMDKTEKRKKRHQKRKRNSCLSSKQIDSKLTDIHKIDDALLSDMIRVHFYMIK